ncbi:MAG: HNH endonuclease [Planctomycetes bacterium]|nr:HNH endonuclease [Planctomycetota bacterium]
MTLFVVEVGGEVVFIRHENPHWELVKDPIAPESLDRLIERIHERHGMDPEERDRLAIAKRALDRGIQAWEARPLAEAVLAELRKAIAGEGGSWYRVCEALGAAVLRRSASTTSELLSCGKACRRFPELDRAFRAGDLSWTKVRTLAPRLDRENFEMLFPLLSTASERELEAIRAALERKARRGPPLPRERRFPVEMEAAGWDRLEDLRVELYWRTKRHWKKEEALEEALWQALVAWGSPAPLWRSYRVTVHVDPATDIHWVRGPGELLALSRDEVGVVRRGDTVDFDLGEALARAARREEETASGTSGGHRFPEWGPGGRGIPLAEIVAHGDRAPPSEPWLKRLVYLRHSEMCSSPGCGATLYLDVHHHVERRRGGANHPENLGLDCTRCHATTHSKSGRVVLRAASRAYHLLL